MGKKLLGEVATHRRGDLVAVAQCAIADAHAVVPAGHQFADQVVDGATTRLAEALHTAGHRSIEGGEQFALACVDHRCDLSSTVAKRECQQIE